MIESIKNLLAQWHANNNDMRKLQHTYIVLVLVITFVAGIVALFNGQRSYLLMVVVLAIITTFVTNIVVWSLLKVNVLDKLPRPARTRSK